MYGTCVKLSAFAELSKGVVLSSFGDKRIKHALRVLYTVPLMQPLLNDLDPKVKFKVSEDKRAFYRMRDNTVFVPLYNPTSLNDQVNFYGTLAHEACHADQYNWGLAPHNVRNYSFEHAFRIGKMMEVDALLCGSVVEDFFSKKYNCDHLPTSFGCQYYRALLKKYPSNTQDLNRDFLLSFWQNEDKSGLSYKPFKKGIEAWNHGYFKQSIRNSLYADCAQRRGGEGQMPASDMMALYLERMSVKGLNPELFLQNEFDNTVIHNGDSKIALYDSNGVKKCEVVLPTYSDLSKGMECHYFQQGKISRKTLIDMKSLEESDISNVKGVLSGRWLRSFKSKR